LAKVSPDCLNLVDDPELFVPGSSELFGKKFKKAILKDLKLSKEMDRLMSGCRHGNGKNNYKQESPVMGPKHGFQLLAVESTEPVPRGIFSQREIQLPKSGETTLTGTVPIRFIKQVMRKQSSPKSVPPVQSLISSRLKIDFQAVITPGALAGRLRLFLPNWQQITPLSHGSGLQARVDLAPDSQQNQGPSSFFTHRIRENRHRNYCSLGQRGIEQGRAGFRPVSKQYFLGSQAGREIATGDQPKIFERSYPIRSFQN
jgi:hypothetical protein